MVINGIGLLGFAKTDHAPIISLVAEVVELGDRGDFHIPQPTLSVASTVVRNRYATWRDWPSNDLIPP